MASSHPNLVGISGVNGYALTQQLQPACAKEREFGHGIGGGVTSCGLLFYASMCCLSCGTSSNIFIRGNITK